MNLLTSLFKQFIRHKISKHIVLIFVLLSIMFIAIWTRAFIGSMKDFTQGEIFFHNKQYIKAITFFDRSLHWYAPLNPYIERSAEYLFEISEQAEQINDDQLSLIALESIINSFYSSRSFYLPGINWVDRCEGKIRSIVKNQKEMILQKSDVDIEDTIYESTMKYNDPKIFWTLVLEICFFGWIGAILGFIFFYLRPCVKTNKYIYTYWFWIILLIFNYGLWIICMIKA